MYIYFFFNKRSRTDVFIYREKVRLVMSKNWRSPPSLQEGGPRDLKIKLGDIEAKIAEVAQACSEILPLTSLILSVSILAVPGFNKHVPILAT